MVDDDLAYVAPWGFDPATSPRPSSSCTASADRVVPSSHALWLADRIPSAELWLRPGDGHVSVLDAATDALDWLLSQVDLDRTGESLRRLVTARTRREGGRTPPSPVREAVA